MNAIGQRRIKRLDGSIGRVTGQTTWSQPLRSFFVTLRLADQRMRTHVLLLQASRIPHNLACVLLSRLPVTQRGNGCWRPIQCHLMVVRPLLGSSMNAELFDKVQKTGGWVPAAMSDAALVTALSSPPLQPLPQRSQAL